MGGRGQWFVETIPKLGTNVVAMCDVNEQRAADSFKRIPEARKYHDFRKMFYEMDKEIDAVIIATPDHIRTESGLTVTAQLDTNNNPLHVKISKKQLQDIELQPHSFHGEWNYTISPKSKKSPQ